MSYVAEIASAAKHISAKELSETSQNVEIAALKKSMEVEKLIQEQLANMITSVMPHLGNAVNTSA